MRFLMYAEIVHPILCNCLLVLFWEGSWSQIELPAFHCFSPFSPLTARHFSLFSSLLDSHHYKRYSSPISCSRQIPFASKCIPPAQGRKREVNSSCIRKHNMAILFQCLSWQLKTFLQSCRMSLLEKLQPWTELNLCKAGAFLPYILQMGCLSSGR